MRRVIAGALITVLAVAVARTEPVRPDQRILFTPAPLGGESAVMERKPPQKTGSVAIPKPRPGSVARPAPRNAERNRSVGLSKALDLTAHPPRAASLTSPQPQAVDFSRGVDLGGVSLGVATNQGGDATGSGGTGLVTLDNKTPIPSDPALATRSSIPYFGLSLSAPTN